MKRGGKCFTGKIISLVLILSCIFTNGIVYAETGYSAQAEGNDSVSQITNIKVDYETRPEDPYVLLEGIASGQSQPGDTMFAQMIGSVTDVIFFGEVQPDRSFKIEFSVSDNHSQTPDGEYTIQIINANLFDKIEPEKSYTIRFDIKDDQVVDDWNKVLKGGVSNSSGNYLKPVPQSGFNDIDGHWAKTAIENLAQKGIVKGYENGYFLPNATVTRAEFAQIVKQAFGYQVENGVSGFSDVTENAWYFNPVLALTEKQIIFGTASDQFSPNENITREQMVSILERVLNDKKVVIEEERDGVDFIDSNEISSYAKAAVQHFYKLGIVSGFKTEQGSDYRFKPKAHASRAEVSVIINNVLERVNDTTKKGED